MSVPWTGCAPAEQTGDFSAGERTVRCHAVFIGRRSTRGGPQSLQTAAKEWDFLAENVKKNIYIVTSFRDSNDILSNL